MFELRSRFSCIDHYNRIVSASHPDHEALIPTSVQICTGLPELFRQNFRRVRMVAPITLSVSYLRAAAHDECKRIVASGRRLARAGGRRPWSSGTSGASCSRTLHARSCNSSLGTSPPPCSKNTRSRPGLASNKAAAADGSPDRAAGHARMAATTRRMPHLGRRAAERLDTWREDLARARYTP